MSETTKDAAKVEVEEELPAGVAIPAIKNSATESARNGGTARRAPVRVERDGEGVLFVNSDQTYAGALRIGDELFQCIMTPARSSSGLAYWVLDGHGDRGDALSGAVFSDKRGAQTAGGGARPQISGRVTTVAGVTRRMAGWARAARGHAFYSLRLTRSPDTSGNLELPLDLPVQRAPTRQPATT